MIKSLSIALLSLWLLLPSGAGAQTPDAWQHPLAERAGVVQKLDFAAQTMIIDGMSYEVAVDVKVEIAGSYGAFTMLEPGMRVHYEFRRVSDATRVVTAIKELPGNVELPGV